MPHPAALLLLWIFFVLFLQQAAFPIALTLALPILVIALWFARSRSMQLLWRARWLLLTMSALFIWGTPGEYIAWLPLATWEGLASAAEQGLRLILLLLLLAVLLQALNRERLVAGLYPLLYPLTWFGLHRERVAVRLLLVLRYIETPAVLPQGRLPAWRHWLEPVDFEPVHFELVLTSPGWRDYALVGLGLIPLLALGLS